MYPRPRTRGDCIDGPRPCPWAACRHHLLIDKVRLSGELSLAYDEDDETPRETCSLDVAKRGDHALAEVGAILGVSRERVRQVEEDAGVKVRLRLSRDILDGFAHEEPPTAGEDWDFIGPDFKAAVDAAYRRIVPESERGLTHKTFSLGKDQAK